MLIYGTLRHEVEINPLDVINKLLVSEIGYGKYVKIVKCKPYIAYEDHHMEIISDVPISKESYEYNKALELVKKTLTEKK